MMRVEEQVLALVSVGVRAAFSVVDARGDLSWQQADALLSDIDRKAAAARREF
jgi:hypothetical protein